MPLNELRKLPKNAINLKSLKVPFKFILNITNFQYYDQQGKTIILLFLL